MPDLAVAAGFGGGPRVTLFRGTSLLSRATPFANFFAFPEDAETLRNGTYVSIGDVNGDGFGDLIFGGGPGGAPRIFILQGSLISAGNISGATSSPIANFFAGGNVDDRGGVRVAVSNSDGDSQAEVFAASGLNVAGRIRVYRGSTFTGSGEPAGAQVLDVFSGALADGIYVG